MPTWSGILEELGKSRSGDGLPQFDAVRRKYLTSLQQYTKREVINVISFRHSTFLIPIFSNGIGLKPSFQAGDSGFRL